MDYLFFITHPAKFHVFRNTINYLKQNQHNVDILIIKKDILEELLISEGWNYCNIFPEGRKINGIPIFISIVYNFIRTIYRLYKWCKGKKYDLFVSSDLLIILSSFFKTDSIAITDDDLSIIKKYSIVLSRAKYILAPEITDLGKFNQKKIGFNSYKELAYLHPNHFNPNISVVKDINKNLNPYFVIRLVSLKSWHDGNKNGLSDLNVLKLIDLLKRYGKVYISSERKLSNELEKYRLYIKPNFIKHFIYYSHIFIGDSQSMCSEAALMGVPSFRCNDYKGLISVMNEKDEKYKLSFSYYSTEFNNMYKDIKKLLQNKNFKNEFLKRKNKMLMDKIDLSKFMNWFFENYPQSLLNYKNKLKVNNNFK